MFIVQCRSESASTESRSLGEKEAMNETKKISLTDLNWYFEDLASDPPRFRESKPSYIRIQYRPQEVLRTGSLYIYRHYYQGNQETSGSNRLRWSASSSGSFQQMEVQ